MKKEFDYKTDSYVFLTSTEGTHKEPGIETSNRSFFNNRHIDPWFSMSNWATVSDEVIREEYGGISHEDMLPR